MLGFVLHATSGKKRKGGPKGGRRKKGRGAAGLKEEEKGQQVCLVCYVACPN